MRGGFTLIEVLVALLLFELGMLALTGVTVVAARDLASANLTARAHAVARNRVETLRSSRCPTPASGSASDKGIVERWHVSAEQNARRIADSVEFQLPSGRIRRVVREAWMSCT
jgi:type IV pilus modification protein PilV